MNNGITILTEEATLVTNKEIILKNPEIVNGLQTSNEIYEHFRRNPTLLNTEKRNILVRIIVPETEESRDRIILATNNQTNIPKSSLRANDPIHRQIELYFKNHGLFYDRRKNFYKNTGKKSSEIISVSFLAQCMMSLLLQKPHYARARPSTLLMNDDIYNLLYIQNNDLDVFFNAAKLGRKIELFLKHAPIYTQAQRNDILFYVLFLSVALSIGRAEISAKDIKQLDLTCFSESSILSIAKQVFDLYVQLGGDGKTAKGSELITRITEVINSSRESGI